MLASGDKYEQHNLRITRDDLEADLCIPFNAKAIVLFAHGSGSGRYSSRNQYLAQVLNQRGIGTLLIDLLTQQEKEIDSKTKHLRFNIQLLSSRFESITNWLTVNPRTKMLDICYFGSSTGAAAALSAACKFRNIVKTIVIRSGRPDLAENRLQEISVPTLFITGGLDPVTIEICRRALRKLELTEDKELVVIPRAGHCFDEAGTIEEVGVTTLDWFDCHLNGSGKHFRSKYTQRARHSFSNFKMRSLHMVFKDRSSAGEMLATLLGKYRNDSPLVLGVPKGGAIVGEATARKLSADFGIILARRLRSPVSSEVAIGAVAQDGSLYLDNALIGTLAISDDYLKIEIEYQMNLMSQMLNSLRPLTNDYLIRDRNVIIVDDGAATGATIVAVARSVKKHLPKTIALAVPVASPRAKHTISGEIDHIVMIRSPEWFRTVEEFYGDFDPVSDQQLIDIKERIEKGFPRSS